jgi:hypothetical protein
VVKWHTIKAMSALARVKGWKVHHLDVKTVFLNNRLWEMVFMYQPQGYKQLGSINLVCKCNCALSGFKHAPCEWFHKIDNDLQMQSHEQIFIIWKFVLSSM